MFVYIVFLEKNLNGKVVLFLVVFKCCEFVCGEYFLIIVSN